MHIIPVIDIAGGRVVHAQGGYRQAYLPIQSEIVASDDPAEVAAALRDATGSQQLYVADIGAYQGRSRDWQTLKQLGLACQSTGVEMLIDFGIINSIDAISAFELLDQTISASYKLIVALESMEEMVALEMITDRFSERTVFSLDLHGGEVRAADEAYAQRSPIEITSLVIDAGITELIVLDTADVGGKAGCSSVAVCRAIRSAHAKIRLLGGGGVRNRSDVAALLEAGCDAVLLATAIHQGQWT